MGNAQPLPKRGGGEEKSILINNTIIFIVQCLFFQRTLSYDIQAVYIYQVFCFSCYAFLTWLPLTTTYGSSIALRFIHLLNIQWLYRNFRRLIIILFFPHLCLEPIDMNNKGLRADYKIMFHNKYKVIWRLRLRLLKSVANTQFPNATGSPRKPQSMSPGPCYCIVEKPYVLSHLTLQILKKKEWDRWRAEHIWFMLIYRLIRRSEVKRGGEKPGMSL